jgi:hypothetical protein
MSMRLPYSRVALASGLVLALAACGGSDNTGSNGNGNGNGGSPDAGEPQGDNYSYVIDELRIPTSAAQANQLGLDLDGDGETDNALGVLLSTLGSVVGDIDLQATLNAQFLDGTIIVLAELKATSLANASNSALWIYLGDNPSTEPCVTEDDCGHHLDGQTSFDLAANSPTTARVDGTISGGSFSGGPGIVSLQLALVDDIPPLNVDLVGARVEIESVSETGLASGRIGGGITLVQIENELIPAIAAGLSALLEAECAGEGEEPEPCGCPEDSAAEIVQETFDTDNSCDISAAELLANDIVATLIQADVDLLDENGNFDPTPESDPNFSPDSMSLGVGFSAVGAVFTSPNQ